MSVWMNKRRRIAAFLGYNPDDEKSWPIEIVERLVKLREDRGEEALIKEYLKLTTR